MAATVHIPYSAGWLPHADVMNKWYQHQVENLPQYNRPWNDVINEFKKLIENNPAIYMGFEMMFEETKEKEDPTGGKQVTNYIDMLKLFNEFLYQAPDYATEKDWGGLIAFPFNVVINWPMATSAGVALFTSHKVNAMLKKMFDVWAVFLTGKRSLYVLNTETGWLSKDALDTLKVPAYNNPKKHIDFVDAFMCSPSEKHFGFKSWDDFFVRDFRKGIRPVEGSDPPNNNIIVSACESDVLRIFNNVKDMDRFWLKGQPYSLHHMLAGDPDYGKSFDGGIVYQAFLSARSYHRWHSPVKGTIEKIVFVPGTYYAASPSIHFDPAATNFSQPYITQLATRVLIFIKAENQKIGLMCFIAVGMSEVSTCQVTIQDYDHVEKGEELGMFHFGGSTHCLIFTKDAAKHLKFVYNDGKLPYEPDPNDQPHAMLSRKIANVL